MTTFGAGAARGGGRPSSRSAPPSSQTSGGQAQPMARRRCTSATTCIRRPQERLNRADADQMAGKAAPRRRVVHESEASPAPPTRLQPAVDGLQPLGEKTQGTSRRFVKETVARTHRTRARSSTRLCRRAWSESAGAPRPPLPVDRGRGLEVAREAGREAWQIFGDLARTPRGVRLTR